MKKINFCSGPAILPQSVYVDAQRSLLDFKDTGLSILELSHRSIYIVDMIEETKALVKELLYINDEYEILFLHGGASLQFCMIPYNFSLTNNTSIYTLTGQWASNAYNEAKLFSETSILVDSSNQNFSYLPYIEEKYSFDNSNYIHFTSNNTIYGTQWKSFPKCNIPLIVDMSSDIFSKKIEVNNFDLIYAGAQKNLGAAGVCMVIIKKAMLEKQNKNIPTMLDYAVHVKNNSSFNTPPVFAIYTCLLNLQWLKMQGGVEKIEEVNNKKAAVLYNEIERNSLFECVVKNEKDRSIMNAVFVAKNNDIEKSFKKFCLENGIVGIDGYRTVGGFRASLYNALPLESVETFVEMMKNFETNHA
jgi:phosphoserine aminotransferase